MRQTITRTCAAALVAMTAACGGRIAAPTPAATTPPDSPAATDPAAPPAAPTTNEAVADYRGFIAVDNLLRQRLTTPTFSLVSYLGDDGSNLALLLGFGYGDGQHSQFQNGKANAINLVLWHMALGGVARDLASVCAAPPAKASTAKYGRATLRPDLAKELAPLCAWPAASARTPEVLDALWNTVVEDDAPAEELAAFKDFMLGADMAQANGADALSGMLTAMFLNPHFLIRQ